VRSHSVHIRQMDRQDEQAPTLGQILARDYSFCASCDSCRLLVQVDAERLAAAKGKNIRVDQLKLRCRRCGGPGEPHVPVPGNATVGRPPIWPPARDAGGDSH